MFDLGGTEAGIVYNKKAFKDSGITKIPTTLDELYAAVEKLKANKNITTPMLTNFKDGWPLMYYNDLIAFFAGHAGIPNDKLSTDTPFTIDGPYGKAYNIMRELKAKGAFEKDIFSTDWEQIKKDLGSGKAAMTFIGQWMVSQTIDNGGTSDNLGFFPFPYDNSGQSAVLLAPDWSIGVNKNSKNLATAKAWVKFIVTESGYADDSGLVPTLKDQKPKIPQLAELSTFNPKVYEYIAIDPTVTDIEKKIQFDTYKFLQESLTAPDLKAVFDQYNKKWADGKKAAGK